MFIPHLPSRKPSKVRKEFPPITLLGYSWVHKEVIFYESSFSAYEFVTDFLESIEFFHIDGSDVMVIESCIAIECVFMRPYPAEAYFIYMYFTLFSNPHFTIPFNKFEINFLRELNLAPTQLHLNA